MSLDGLRQAVNSFKSLINSNESVKKISKGWNITILFWMKDLKTGLLLDIKQGIVEQITEVNDPNSGAIKIVATSSIIYEMFSGNEKVTRLYMEGAIEAYGSEKDLVRLDAISAILWPD